MPPNKNKMATSTNKMAVSTNTDTSTNKATPTDMDPDRIYIMINASYFLDP